MIRLLSRGLLVIHRYLGVGVGLLMTLWCLSGFVMLYQGFPSLTDAERLEGLQPLDLSACCDLDRLAFKDDQVVPGFRVEMLNGDPVIRFSGTPRRGAAVQNAPKGSYNLRTGEPVKTLNDAEVRQVAAEYAARHGLEGVLVARRLDKVDQWTIQAGRRAPLYQIAVNDPAGSEIYVSAASGEVVQDTNRRERVLSWFGAIPHWLYPTVLRSDAALWTQVVIWTSVAGVFLTVTGLYVGISRFGRRKNGRWSPFRGLWYWHHIIGLVFGLFTLTWVLSGLLTMNPWGLARLSRHPQGRSGHPSICRSADRRGGPYRRRLVTRLALVAQRPAQSGCGSRPAAVGRSGHTAAGGGDPGVRHRRMDEHPPHQA